MLWMRRSASGPKKLQNALEETEALDRPHAVPCEEVAGEGADDPHPPLRGTLSRKRERDLAGRGVDLLRVSLSERIRLVRQKDDVGLQRQDVVELELRITSTIAKQVPSAGALHQIGDIRVAAAPHPRFFPDWD